MLHAGHQKIFHDSRLHCWGPTSLGYHSGSTLREESSSELENHRRILGGSVLSAKAFCFICYLLFLGLLVRYLFTFLLPVLSRLLLVPVEWPGLLVSLAVYFADVFPTEIQ